MPKIIGYDQSLMKQCTCKSCRAILEYSPDEVTRRTHIDISGSSEFYYTIDCANCEFRVEVPAVYPTMQKKIVAIESEKWFNTYVELGKLRGE